jgi:hypothetical protein
VARLGCHYPGIDWKNAVTVQLLCITIDIGFAEPDAPQVPDQDEKPQPE